jgi:hypothetical protein
MDSMTALPRLNDHLREILTIRGDIAGNAFDTPEQWSAAVDTILAFREEHQITHTQLRAAAKRDAELLASEAEEPSYTPHLTAFQAARAKVLAQLEAA